MPKRFSNAFTHWTDALHALVGFACAVLRKVFWPLALAIALAFVVYEALEAESKTTSYEDLTEFVVGFIVGLILLP